MEKQLREIDKTINTKGELSDEEYNKIKFSKISLLLIGKSSGFNPKNYSKYLRNLKLIIRY